jgi:hypothetical protein
VRKSRAQDVFCVAILCRTRSRSRLAAAILVLIGVVNALGTIVLLLTNLTRGDAFSYLWIVASGLSALACLLAVAAILDRRKGAPLVSRLPLGQA